MPRSNRHASRVRRSLELARAHRTDNLGFDVLGFGIRGLDARGFDVRGFDFRAALAHGAWLLAAAILMLPNLALAQDTVTTQAEPVDILERADDIARETADVRGVAPTGPITKGVMARDALRDLLVEKLEEEAAGPDIDAEIALLKHLELVPADLDYIQLMLDLLTEQIAGFYDDETKELYILEGQSPEFLDAVMSHEIFHAVQDQVWTIARFRGPEHGNADRSIARVAVLEGDATAVMMDFELRGQGVSFTDVPGLEVFIRGSANLSLGASSSVMDRAPMVIRESLVFPYIEGLIFVAAVKREGGWDAVDAIYADPPMSTEQILHPERYIDRDDPTEVTFALPSALDERVWDDTLGELGLRLFLAHHAEAHDASEAIDATAAAAGWDGDRSVLVRHDAGFTFVQLAVFDTEDDAGEYRTALEAALEVRKPAASSARLAGPSVGTRFVRDDRLYWVEQRDDTVLYIDGLPTELDTVTHVLVDTVWLTSTMGRYPTFEDEAALIEAEEARAEGESAPEAKQ